MIVIAGALLGAFVGITLAKKRGGTRADIAQYAVASALAFSIVGMIATVIIEKLVA